MTNPSTMTAKVKAYLAYRRGLGYQLKIEGRMLGEFAAFADRRRHRGPLTSELALRWARATPSADRLYWARRLEVVRCLARHLAATEPGTEIPLRGLLGPAHRRTAPHIYSDAEIAGLMASARKLGPAGGLRPLTFPRRLVHIPRPRQGDRHLLVLDRHPRPDGPRRGQV